MAKYACRGCGKELTGNWGYCSKACREADESRWPMKLPARQIQFLLALDREEPVVKNAATRMALRHHGLITLTDDWDQIELTDMGIQWLLDTSDTNQSHNDLAAASSRSLCDDSQSHNKLGSQLVVCDKPKSRGTEGIPWKMVEGGRCSECKKPFEGWHLQSKTTCSAKCRKARERRQAAAGQAFNKAMSELGTIRSSLKRREEIETFKQQLHRLKAEINDLLALAGDQEELDKKAMFAAVANRRMQP